MRNLHRAGIAGGAGAIMLAVSFIQPWEGLWLTAKVDTIGTGRPITYCYGATEGNVKAGEKFTPKQCSDILAKTLPKYDAEITPCIHVPVSDKTRAALISFAYNVGSHGACHSSAFAKLNMLDYFGACDALMQWTHAQGRVVKGLVNRRTAERKLCLEGINDARINRREDTGISSPILPSNAPLRSDSSRPWWRGGLFQKSL